MIATNLLLSELAMTERGSEVRWPAWQCQSNRQLSGSVRSASRTSPSAKKSICIIARVWRCCSETDLSRYGDLLPLNGLIGYPPVAIGHFYSEGLLPASHLIDVDWSTMVS
jgi:hypothetical protein